MAQCKRIRIPHRKYCAGDLRERITLEDRDIQPPFDTNFTESFSNPTIIPAAVKTISGGGLSGAGVTVFDSSNIEQVVTHDFIIRFRVGVTQEKWIRWRNERYNILVVENVDGRNEWLRMRTTVRGDDTLEVNRA